MRHSFDKDYWDRIWDGDRATSMATGQPSPYLLQEVGDLKPGTALDAGCGGGAEAIWLAGRGWRVTAADIAAAALARAAERAAAAGVAGRVRWVEADLSTWQPGARYDLVTTHYAHPAMPQLDFYDRIASWVAPAGTLLVVGHLHHHDQDPAHGHAAVSVTAADITARLDPAEWDVVTARESRRAVTGHAVPLHDVVVRAVRRPFPKEPS